MEKKNLNQLYKAARNRGYAGSFADFAASHNSYLTELARTGGGGNADDFLNDTGAVAAEQQSDQTVYQQPVHETREVPMYYQQQQPQARLRLPEVRDEDDDSKIWGIKKPVFYGGVAILVLLFLAGVWYFVFRKPSGIKYVSAPSKDLGNENTTNENTGAANQSVANTADAGSAGANNTAAAASGAGNTAAAA